MHDDAVFNTLGCCTVSTAAHHMTRATADDTFFSCVDRVLHFTLENAAGIKVGLRTIGIKAATLKNRS